MKLDLGSFAFGSIVSTGGGTPSWGTALGQGKGLKFTYPGWENIMSGILYKSVATSKIYMPIGKGGHIYNGLEDEGIQFAAVFDMVYINEVRVNASFVLVVYRDSSTSWEGRRTLKYSDKIEYRESNTRIVRNSDFISAARQALQIDEDACWIVSDIYIEDQDTLHLFAGIVDAHNTQTFSSHDKRKMAWLESIKNTLSYSSIYKKYCEGASITTKHSSDTKNIGFLQQIFYGAPGTGKSHIINEITEGESVIRTTFHPDSDYSTFVGAYKPTTKEVTLRDISGHPVKENGITLTENKIIYEFVDQAFLQAYVRAWKYFAEADESSEPQKQYLIIEEINRGNCAQIFGDLFQLLDRNCSGFSDYPINADNDMKKQLAKAFAGLSIAQSGKINACYKGKDVTSKVLSGEILLLPNNLYIWATMNTSDQSLFPIDSAFKRRWDWQYMPICKGRDENGNELNWKIAADTKEYDWWSFLTKINDHINSTTNSEDKKLGFFFCKPQDGCISSETFVAKVIFYLWNDVFKDFGFDGPIFKDIDGSELSFNKFYIIDNKGNVVVNIDKVELFLHNLGVEAIKSNDQSFNDSLPEVDEDGNNETTTTKDFSRYSINSSGSYSKGSVVLEAMKIYIANNPQKNADDIKDDWLY